MSRLEGIARGFNRLFPIGAIRALTPRSSEDSSYYHAFNITTIAQLQARIDDTLKRSHMTPQHVINLAGMIRNFGPNRQHQAILVTRILKAAIDAETARKAEATKEADTIFHEQRLKYYRQVLATMIEVGPRRFPSISTMHNEKPQTLPLLEI